VKESKSGKSQKAGIPKVFGRLAVPELSGLVPAYLPSN
jgi:hypothetical protein